MAIIKHKKFQQGGQVPATTSSGNRFNSNGLNQAGTQLINVDFSHVYDIPFPQPRPINYFRPGASGRRRSGNNPYTSEKWKNGLPSDVAFLQNKLTAARTKLTEAVDSGDQVKINAAQNEIKEAQSKISALKSYSDKYKEFEKGVKVNMDTYAMDVATNNALVYDRDTQSTGIVHLTDVLQNPDKYSIYTTRQAMDLWMNDVNYSSFTNAGQFIQGIIGSADSMPNVDKKISTAFKGLGLRSTAGDQLVTSTGKVMDFGTFIGALTDDPDTLIAGKSREEMATNRDNIVSVLNSLHSSVSNSTRTVESLRRQAVTYLYTNPELYKSILNKDGAIDKEKYASYLNNYVTSYIDSVALSKIKETMKEKLDAYNKKKTDQKNKATTTDDDTQKLPMPPDVVYHLSQNAGKGVNITAFFKDMDVDDGLTVPDEQYGGVMNLRIRESILPAPSGKDEEFRFMFKEGDNFGLLSKIMAGDDKSIYTTTGERIIDYTLQNDGFEDIHPTNPMKLHIFHDIPTMRVDDETGTTVYELDKDAIRLASDFRVWLDNRTNGGADKQFNDYLNGYIGALQNPTDEASKKTIKTTADYINQQLTIYLDELAADPDQRKKAVRYRQAQARLDSGTTVRRPWAKMNVNVDSYNNWAVIKWASDNDEAATLKKAGFKETDKPAKTDVTGRNEFVYRGDVLIPLTSYDNLITMYNSADTKNLTKAQMLAYYSALHKAFDAQNYKGTAPFILSLYSNGLDSAADEVDVLEKGRNDSN
jgi:hypothetical protein